MAKTTWGRKETIIWPQNRPIYTYGVILAAIFLTAVFLYGRLRFVGYSVAALLYACVCAYFYLWIVQPDTSQPIPDAFSDRPRPETGACHERRRSAWKDAGGGWAESFRWRSPRPRSSMATTCSFVARYGATSMLASATT